MGSGFTRWTVDSGDNGQGQYMARQLSYIFCCKAFSMKWYFKPKLQVINDEFHPKSLYPHGILADVSPSPGHTYTKATWPPRGRGRGESLTSPCRIEAKLRAAEAIRLRRRGCSYATIAHLLGFRDKSGAWRAIRRASDRIDYDRYARKQR
jgi:hypothetical protein